MATESTSESAVGSAANAQSFAERLLQKHVTSNGHGPTIEDTVDEEDIIHPPPSATHQVEMPLAPTIVPASEPMSEKAMGKQKAPQQPSPADIPPREGAPSVIDTKSEELFPALGGGPKPRAPGPAPAWGAKKPASVANGATNGINGHAQTSSPASSRPSTPASGILTPTSSNAKLASRGNAPQYMSMPGRHTERLTFAPSQLLPRKDLKKPVLDILRDINKRSKATVEMKPGSGGVLVFEGKGPVDAVRQALKDVAKEVGSKQAIKVPIPASVRPHIIGRQGTVVQAISQRTGARIQVPKVEESPYPLEDDDSATIDVSIEGDAVAAEMARREIERIVNERTSTVNMRLRDIPAEFYPFLAGPHGSGVSALEQGRDIKIKVPHYYSWSHQPPPQPASSNNVPTFQPHPSSHIQLSGDRRAVQEARAEIDRQVAALRQQITLAQLAINRGQHQFIVGDRGDALHDLLQETGCAVILPPDTDDTEMLTITGPQDKIELGMDKVMNLATSMQMSSIDVGRQHSNAPMGAQAHARALTRYLQEREAIAKLERMYDSRIVLPTSEDGPVTWEVYSRDGKNTIRARSDIMNIINAHPPSRLRQMEMDPFFYEHLRNEHRARVREDHGVHVLLPGEADLNPQVVLVYDGSDATDADFEFPRQRPSQAETAQFDKALQQAQEHIMRLINGQEPISVRELKVPAKFHEKVRKFVDREQQDLRPEMLPVQVVDGSVIKSSSDPPSQDTSAQGVLLRGPENRLDAVAEKVRAFVESEKQDELERGFTMSFDFPQKHANYLIGRRGENINKLREEFDVEIQVNDGKVELKGPKAKAESAKSNILAMSKKLDDEATHVLKIKPQFHREMIGAKGSQVNRLQDRYNVRVQFPRTTHNTHEDDEVASEAGTPRHSRSSQAPDEVVIRGPRKGADEARDELLNLLQWTIDNSHSSVISVAQSQLPSLIGQGGREMESLRETTGAKIDVPGSREAADPSGRVELKIKGTKKQVDDAKKMLEEKVKVFDDSVIKVIDVDKKYHKSLIGTGGANIRNMVINAGGSDDRRELARTVRFPRQDSDGSAIRVEGNKAIVEKLVEAINAFVNERENQVTEIIEIAQEKHRLLIGHGGETRKALESRFKVNIDIPRQTVQGPQRSHVKLAGPPEDVEKAKQYILELVRDQEAETIQVPRGLHNVVSDNGQFFRRLRQDHKVTVDHAGQQPPPKASNAPRSRVNGGGSLPLITDDQNSVDNHSWEVVDHGSDDTEMGEIPWVLRGSPENVARARATVQRALEQAQKQGSTGYLILPDPRTYRLVIGPGGSQINSIRKQTGCKINVPRDQAKGEAIEIVGSSQGVEQAKDIILETVKNGATHGNGDGRPS
ncbi:hypothetical protein MMC15_001627 [Xylographa vitiligo]|nr:hypothetical protein [Xylographa vitiligo]